MTKSDGTFPRAYFKERILSDFPNFDDPELRDVGIPVRFSYTGWKNAECPSFTDEKRGEKIWIDWEDPDERESDHPRFQFDRYVPEEDQYEMVFACETWEEFCEKMGN